MSESKETQSVRKKEYWLLFCSMSLLSFIGFGILYFAKAVSLVAFLKYSFLTIFSVYLFFILLKESKQKRLFCCCYVVSLVLTVIGKIITLDIGWLTGGWMFSIVCNPFLGMLMQVLFCFVNGFLCQSTLELFLWSFLFTVGMCVLMPYVRKVSNLGYVILLGILTKFMLLILQEDLIWKNILTWKTLRSVMAVFGYILLSAFGGWLLRGFVVQGNASFIRKGFRDFFQEEQEVWEEGTFAKIEDVVRKREIKENALDSFLKPDYELRLRLQKELPKVYSHSLMAAQVSKTAARQLQADEQLCYAGGLYHEIGKLEDSDYIQAGILLAKAKHFPRKLQAILEQHNVRGGVAKTPEAAIVMMTDSVLSVLERVGEKSLSQQKEMIKKLFLLRLEQGALEASGLSLQDYRKLLCFFMNWTEKQG